MKDILKHRRRHLEQMLLHPVFEGGSDAVHLIDSTHKGRFEGVRSGAGKPKTDSHEAVILGIETLDIRIRRHQILSGFEGRRVLFVGVYLTGNPDAYPPLHAGGLINLPAEAERDKHILLHLQAIEAHQGEKGQGVLRMTEARVIWGFSLHRSLLFLPTKID